MKPWIRSTSYRRVYPLPILILLVFLCACMLLLDMQLRPVIESVSENEARNTSINTINAAVLDELNAGTVSYSDLVKIERDTDGKVLSITTDMVHMNQLKAAILQDVRKDLGGLDGHLDVGIPMGTLMGSEILHGRGPKIPLRLTLSGNVTADFESSFTSAGINQTKHQIYLKVKTSVYSFLPGFPTTTDVETNVPVAETIIVGEVPQIMANLK